MPLLQVHSGVQSASVVDNKDPNQMGRVKVSFPWDGNSTQSNWARVVQPLGGNKYGYYFLPEVGDTVLVAFENDNHDHPVVIGSMYTGEAKQEDCYDADNYIKNIKTKAGNEIRILDKPGSEQITITNKTANDNQIILTVSDNGKITIQSKGKIELTAPEIDLSANKTFNIKGGEINISGTKISLKSDGDMALSGSKITATGDTGVELSASGGDVKMSALNVQATANLGLALKANTTAELSAVLETTIKGGMVMIN
jgi:type VI secretion system secreted protein VgrG